MLNYISNAIKYTSKGQITITTDFEKKKNGQQNKQKLQITVSDTGIGILKDDFPKLFKAHSRLDASISLNPHGVGMGLNICKQITKQMGGRVWVRSELGTGSTFGFSFKFTKNLVHNNEQPKANQKTSGP